MSCVGLQQPERFLSPLVDGATFHLIEANLSGLLGHEQVSDGCNEIALRERGELKWGWSEQLGRRHLANCLLISAKKTTNCLGIVAGLNQFKQMATIFHVFCEVRDLFVKK